MIFDMHIHTNQSDGEMTVDEIISKIKESGLSYFSITDHEIFTIITEEQIARTGADYCPGIEFTCSPDHLHILGYFPLGISKNTLKFVSKINSQRTIELMRIIRVLRKMGISLSNEFRINYSNTIKYLISIGYAENEKKVKEKLFSNSEISDMKRQDPDMREVIDMIHNSRGFAIAAHPLRENNREILSFYLEHNIDGFEVYHPSHSYDDIIYLKKFCDQKDLLITGGSDAHKKDTFLGRYSNHGIIQKNMLKKFHEIILKMRSKNGY